VDLTSTQLDFKHLG